MSEYYNHTTVPSTGSSLSSATMRAEFDSVEAGFDKLPVLAGNALKFVRVNAGATALESVVDPTDAHIADTSGAHAASAIANTPAGNLSATDVQAAINELDSEKLATNATALNGTNIPASKTLVVTTDAGTVFEAANANIVKKNVANTFTAVQVPVSSTSAVSTTSTFTYSPATHGQDCEITLTNAITVTLAAAAGTIVAGAYYTLTFKAGDTSVRSFAKGATVLAPAATLPIASASITTNGRDVFHLRGVDANTVMVVGSSADVR